MHFPVLGSHVTHTDPPDPVSQDWHNVVPSLQVPSPHFLQNPLVTLKPYPPLHFEHFPELTSHVKQPSPPLPVVHDLQDVVPVLQVVPLRH